MGANQSVSKQQQQVSPSRLGSHQLTTKPAKQHSSSLRKSMGNMLAKATQNHYPAKWKQQQQQQQQVNNVVGEIGGSLLANSNQHDNRSVVDSYYVSVPTRKNNYVTYEQQQQQQQQQVVACKRPSLSQLEQRMAAANAAANNGSVYGNNNSNRLATTMPTSGSQRAFEQQQKVETTTNSATIVRNGSFEQQQQQHVVVSRLSPQEQSAIQNYHQRTHHHHNHHQQQQQQQQKQQQHQQSTPFHLSRAVNTKTSCVLNNNNNHHVVAMQTKSATPTTNCRNQSNGQLVLASGCSPHLANSSSNYLSTRSSYLLSTGQELPVDDIENRYIQQDQQSVYHQQQQYHQFQPSTTTHHHLLQQYHHQFPQTTTATIDFHQVPLNYHSHYNSKTLDSSSKNKKKSNTSSAGAALASLFQPNKQQANTIHLTRRSHQQQQKSSMQRSAPGSLKRLKPVMQQLSGQQATYEAMRTIDMYLIRQIARSCMDFEMEQKIELEIRLRELAAQSLLEATSELDVLEVEKSLLTSDQRMNCYATLLEQQRKQLSNPSLVSSQTTDSGRGSRRGNRLSSSSRHVDGNKRASTDVIGATTTTTTAAATNEQVTTGSGSPVTSYSSLSNSTQSPSKLSPVSGESSNNIYNSYYSPNSMMSSQNGTSNYQIRATTTGNGNSNISPDDSAAHLRLSSSSQLIMTTPPPMLTTTINSTSTLLSNKQLALTNHNNNNKTNNRKNNRQREQLMQSITSLSNINCNMVVEHKASLSISELRIPLMWKDVDHFKGKGDYKRYAVFCLLRIDSQIYDTQLISDVDRQVTDVTFDELVVFNQVKQSFELQLEVYSCVYYEQFSLSSTPRKLKEKLTSSVSKAMGKRLTKQTASTNFTKELKGYEQKSYRFAKIAHTSLKLEDVSNCDEVKTYDLILISPSAHNRSSQQSSSLCQMSNHQSMNNYLSSPAAADKMNDCSYQHQHHLSAEQSKEAERNTLPLFGHFCAKLVCQPNVFDKTIKSGYLRVALINVPEQQQQQQMSNLNNNTTDHHHSNDTQKLRSTLVATSKQMATLSMSTAQLHWALLRNFAIHLWPIDEQQLEAALRNNQLPHLELSKRPTLTLPVDRYARLLRVSNSSITLDTERGCFVLAAYNCSLIDNSSGNTSHHQVVCDETSQWLRAIEQLIYDSHIWGSVLNHQRSNITANNNCDNTTSTTSLPRRTISTNQHQHLTGRQQQQQHYAGNVLQADF